MEHGVTGFVGFLAVIVLLTVVGSRLLGVRLPLRRALLIGFPSLVAGFVVGYLVNRRHPGQITPLVAVTAVLAAMLLMVLAELLSRSGGRPNGRGPLQPFFRLRWTARSTGRYLQLARIGVRHGLAGMVRGRGAGTGEPGQVARRLRLALEQAGPIFVKLGQVASTRTDLLPAPVTTELAKLQDQVPPAPWRGPSESADPDPAERGGPWLEPYPANLSPAPGINQPPDAHLVAPVGPPP